MSEHVQFWMAEARRYRREQDASNAEKEALAPKASLAVQNWRRQVIREYREKNRFTAGQFARRVGMSETAIQGIVKDDYSRFAPETRQRLLDVLGVTLEDWTAAHL